MVTPTPLTNKGAESRGKAGYDLGIEIDADPAPDSGDANDETVWKSHDRTPYSHLSHEPPRSAEAALN